MSKKQIKLGQLILAEKEQEIKTIANKLSKSFEKYDSDDKMWILDELRKKVQTDDMITQFEKGDLKIGEYKAVRDMVYKLNQLAWSLGANLNIEMRAFPELTEKMKEVADSYDLKDMMSQNLSDLI